MARHATDLASDESSDEVGVGDGDCSWLDNNRPAWGGGGAFEGSRADVSESPTSSQRSVKPFLSTRRQAAACRRRVADLHGRPAYDQVLETFANQSVSGAVLDQLSLPDVIDGTRLASHGPLHDRDPGIPTGHFCLRYFCPLLPLLNLTNSLMI